MWALKCKKSESFAPASFSWTNSLPELSTILLLQALKHKLSDSLAFWSLLKLGFSHKSSAVRPCHMPAPPGSRMSSSHTSLQGPSDSQNARTSPFFKDLLLTLSFPSARSAIPVVSLWDTQSYWWLWIHQDAQAQTAPGFLAHFHKSCELFRLVHPHQIWSKGSKTTNRTDTLLERVQVFFPSCILVPPC